MVCRVPLHQLPVVPFPLALFHSHEAVEMPWPAHLSTGLVRVPTTADSDSDSEEAFHVRLP